jgi:hypothetical protein
MVLELANYQQAQDSPRSVEDIETELDCVLHMVSFRLSMARIRSRCVELCEHSVGSCLGRELKVHRLPCPLL